MTSNYYNTCIRILWDNRSIYSIFLCRLIHVLSKLIIQCIVSILSYNWCICADEVATQKHLIWYSCWVDIYYRYVGNYIACWYIVFDFKKYYLFKNIYLCKLVSFCIFIISLSRTVLYCHNIFFKFFILIGNSKYSRIYADKSRFLVKNSI